MGFCQRCGNMWVYWKCEMASGLGAENGVSATKRLSDWFGVSGIANICLSTGSGEKHCWLCKSGTVVPLLTTAARALWDLPMPVPACSTVIRMNECEALKGGGGRAGWNTAYRCNCDLKGRALWVGCSTDTCSAIYIK